MAIEPVNRSRRYRWFAWLLRQIEHVFALIGLGLIVYMNCFDLSRVTSGSMKPTLQGEDMKSGDLVFTERVSYWFRGPRRWEVVSLRRVDGVQVFKRVVGLPGETLQIRRNGHIVIDGQELEPPQSVSFLKYVPYALVNSDKKVVCGDGYFVLGDDTMDSDDSRYNGPSPRSEVDGRPWLILAPSGRRGFVQPILPGH